METSVAGKEILRKGVQMILGYICALPSFMGYHPLIPVYFSLCCLEKKNVVLVYGAVILGLINQMKFAAIFKYGILMLVIGMAIYFYRSNSVDGWKNLAVDRFFLENLDHNDIVLYFY